MVESQTPKVAKKAQTLNKRGMARLAAVQALYQLEIRGTDVTDMIEEFKHYRLGKEVDEVLYSEADQDWFARIVRGVVTEQRELDPWIKSALTKRWNLNRIDSILRAILRAASYELLRRKEVPAKVTISEYIIITEAFFQGKEVPLVNGILDKIAHEFRPEEFGEVSQ